MFLCQEKVLLSEESLSVPKYVLMSNTTDLIIVGAGPGGYRAAEYAARQGLKVTVFEAGEVGGTCLNVGCIPTKTYVHAATFDEARSRMAQVVPQLRQGVESILAHPNITLVRGRAAFMPPIAPNIIIATGSETKWLPIEGARTDPRVVDSTGLLQLERLPRRLAIIGAGVIGMEFASVFRASAQRSRSSSTSGSACRRSTATSPSACGNILKGRASPSA